MPHLPPIRLTGATILREGEKEPFDLTITRDIIKLTVVKTRIEGHAVVLRVTTFNDETMSTLRTEMEKAIQQAGGIDKVTGFVLDLRILLRTVGAVLRHKGV